MSEEKLQNSVSPQEEGKNWFRRLFPEPTEWLQRDGTLKVLDRLVTERNTLLAGIFLFLADRFTAGKVWALIDPLVGLVALPLAGAALFEYWRAKTRRYAVSDDTEKVIIAVSVNQDVSASVQKHFGRTADVLISAAQEVGAKFLSPGQMHELANKLAAACLPHRDKVIYLVLAGPPGLGFQVGQLLGAHKFRVVPLYWAGTAYQELPMMGVEDIGF